MCSGGGGCVLCCVCVCVCIGCVGLCCTFDVPLMFA